MAFTNFCCRTGGSNANAGTRTGDTTVPGINPDVVFTSGQWTSTTRTYVASGNPIASGVAIGDWVSIMPGSPTTAVYIARVTGVTSNSIITSATAFMGAVPTTSSGNMNCRVGGAWSGPSGSVTFPFSLATVGTATNADGSVVRINLKNDKNYLMGGGISTANWTIGQLEGFSNSYGDGGFAYISHAAVPSFNLLTISSASTQLIIKNILFDGSGATTGSNALISHAGSNGTHFCNCGFYNFIGIGIAAGAGGSISLLACQFSSGNRLNNANVSCMNATSTNLFVTQTIFQNSTGINSHGLVFAATSPNACVVTNSIFTNLGQDGIRSSSQGLTFIRGCDFYKNRGNAVYNQTQSNMIVLDSTFICNSGFGIDSLNSQVLINDCLFGSGAIANGSGAMRSNPRLQEIGNTYYTTTEPWINASTGNFIPNTNLTMNSGYGMFLQLASGFGGTIGYPTIGAAWALSSTAGSTFNYPGMLGGFNG